MKNRDRDFENATRGRRPRAAFASPRSQFFTIRIACVAADSFPFSGGAEIEQANEKRASEGARLGEPKNRGEVGRG